MWRDDDYPDQWREYDQGAVRPSGTGSASLLGLTAEDGQEAESRKVPIGFRAELTPDWRALPSSLEAAIRGAVVAYTADRLDDLEREMRNLGECVWTARDLIRIESTPAVGMPFVDRLVVG